MDDDASRRAFARPDPAGHGAMVPFDSDNEIARAARPIVGALYETTAAEISGGLRPAERNRLLWRWHLLHLRMRASAGQASAPVLTELGRADLGDADTLLVCVLLDRAARSTAALDRCLPIGPAGALSGSAAAALVHGRNGLLPLAAQLDPASAVRRHRLVTLEDACPIELAVLRPNPRIQRLWHRLPGSPGFFRRGV